MPDEDEKSPLEYRNYVDDRPQRRSNIAAMITGMFTGAVVTFIFGCANLSISEVPNPTIGAHKIRMSAIFGCAAVVAGGLSTLALRSEPRRFLLGGFLLGVALTSIMEGICFFG